MAVFLGISCIVLIFSLFGALFGIGSTPGAFGLFFARAFGILALLIPAYFAYAAFILADPKWRPDRIFILCFLVLPFLTLAIGFSLISDFEARMARSAFLSFTGRTGFSMFIVFFTVVQVLLMQFLKTKLFDKENGKFKRRMKSLPPPIEFPPHQAEVSPIDDVTQNQDTQSSLSAFYQYQADTPSLSIISTTDFTSQEEASDENDIEESDAEPLNLKDLEIDIDEEEGDVEKTSEDDDEQNIDEIEDENSDTVTRALEAAEAAAAAHAEQVRNRKGSSTRYKKYKVPVDILNEYPDGEYWVIDQATKDSAVALKETLEEFKIQAEVTGIRKGPVITMFEILPAPGVKLSKIVGLQDNIALRLAASSVRIVAPIPGKHAVGIEVPNVKRNIVSFKEIIEHELQSGKKMELPVVMGKDITGEAQTVDLVQMPHLLIAGATGSGKSVCVNSIILSLLYQLHPADCRLMLIDPKIVELKLYNDIPHLLTPVITESKKAFQALQYCIYEMERRYACLDSMGVRDIRSYNKRIKEKSIAQEHLPYIVVVIDEFADLMTTTGKELESTVARLAAMSRAVGIHLVLATQRP
ncbi:MAG: FtsK/SpoIIIE domain-containing protein, partial [Treponema sp.]|nr:FtsK/SpoIIIE domain-containing protein [Treponema sp.]